MADIPSPNWQISAEEKAQHESILSRLPDANRLTFDVLNKALMEAGFQTPFEVSVRRLYTNTRRTEAGPEIKTVLLRQPRF